MHLFSQCNSANTIGDISQQMPALTMGEEEAVPMMLEYPTNLSSPMSPRGAPGIKPYAIMDLHNLDTSQELDWHSDAESFHADPRVPLLLDNSNISSFGGSAYNFINNSNNKLPRVWPYDHNEASGYPPRHNVNSNAHFHHQPMGSEELASPPMSSRGSSEMLDRVSNPQLLRTPMTKPGPNVVRPIAFKPISANNMSPHSSRHPSGDDHVTLPHDLARPQAVKLGTGMLGHRVSPEKSIGGRRIPHQMATGNKSAMHHSTSSHQDTNNLSQHTPVPLGGFRTITINTNSSSQHNIPGNAHNLHNNNMSNANSAHNMSTNSSSHHNISSYSHHSGSQPNHHQHHNNSASFNNSHNASAASSNSHHNTSATSSRLSCAEDSFMGEFAPRPSDRADSVPVAANNSTSSRGWHHAGDGVLQTPSPSDSGVGELEAILREKDAEINTLREVMDRNERAILQVYEERKNAWASDTQELREEYERKLKIQSRKSYKTEQVLSLQVYKLQQEQKALSEEKEKTTEEQDSLKKQLEEANSEISNLRSQLELKSKISDVLDSPDSNEELAIKNKEVINLHTQLHAYQVDMEKKNKELGEKAKEVIGCKEEVEKLKRELDRLKNPPVMCEASSQTHAPCEVANLENVKPSMMGERERTIQTLQEELNELRTQVLGMDDRHEKEKEQWLDEKNKVIRYQKQLQLNYVQMQRKNSTLETEVQQLTLELENRDMKLIALNGEESVC